MITSTKDRILDTAETLFSRDGYEATSLRAIIAEAEVNLAAVHYHFRTKDHLIEAVFLRRAIPANEERLGLLEKVERAAGDGPPNLEGVLEAFILPAFRAAQDPARGGMAFRKLMGRLWAEGDLLPRIAVSHFGPMLARFASALSRALPEVPDDDLFWRVHFAMGAFAQALRGTRGWENFRGSLADSSDTDAVFGRLIPFLSAALRAPVTTAVLQEN